MRALFVAQRVVWGLLCCPGAVEAASYGGGDGQRAVFSGQPDLGGCAGECLGGGAGVEAAIGDQFTGAQAGPEQQPVPFAALRGQQAPQDADQPGLGAGAAVASAGGGGRCGGRPGQAGQPRGQGRQLIGV